MHFACRAHAMLMRRAYTSLWLWADSLSIVAHAAKIELQQKPVHAVPKPPSMSDISIPRSIASRLSYGGR